MNVWPKNEYQVLTAEAAAGATLEPRATMENLLRGVFTKLRQRREVTRQKSLEGSRDEHAMLGGKTAVCQKRISAFKKWLRFLIS